MDPFHSWHFDLPKQEKHHSVLKCAWKPHQWASKHNTGALDQAHLNGMIPSLLLEKLPGLSLLWQGNMSAVKMLYSFHFFMVDLIKLQGMISDF